MSTPHSFYHEKFALEERLMNKEKDIKARIHELSSVKTYTSALFRSKPALLAALLYEAKNLLRHFLSKGGKQAEGSSQNHLISKVIKGIGAYKGIQHILNAARDMFYHFKLKKTSHEK